MFALFYSLYLSMFTGTWQLYSMNLIGDHFVISLNPVFKFLTNIFKDGVEPINDLGASIGILGTLRIVSLVLALITSIGIVVMAVKGIKRVFGVFFMGIR